MRVEIVKNFLTAVECAQLNAWVDSVEGSAAFSNGVTDYVHRTDKRKTTRMSGNTYVYPQFVLDLANRVREFCGVSAYPIIGGDHGRDGIVVSHTFPGGDVYAHRDPRVNPLLAALRCNIMSRGVDAGGILYIEDQAHDIGVGDLHCYLVSEHTHRVTRVEGNLSRVMWMFGAQVPADAWNSGQIQIMQSESK